MSGESPRPLLVVPYWDFFEDAVEGDLRADRAALAGEVEELLAGLGPFRRLWVDSAAAAATVGDPPAAERPPAIVVLQTLATPPAWTADLLDALPDAPVLIAAVQRAAGVDPGFDDASIVALGASVGGAQLASTLARRGRRFRLVAGSLADPELRDRLPAEMRPALAAARVRGSRLLRVGAAIPGYECVEADGAALEAALGVELVEVEPAALRDSYLAVAPDATAEIRGELDAGWEVDADSFEGDTLDRSLRLAAALEGLAREHDVAAGALNCHVPELRLGDDPGVAPCFALGRQTSGGQPWTCTGDVVTAVAMLALKALGLPAWYHEIEAFDGERDEVVLATSGEHDRGLCPAGERPLLHRNPWWPGACARFSPAPGPASLVGFAPAPGRPGDFRFVVAEGEFGSRRFDATGTVNAAFRFDRGPAERAWERWATTGVNHHAAATLGRRSGELSALAEHLGVECVVV